MTLHRIHRNPELDDPVLVMCLEGWIDAGLGAGAAVAHLLAAVETEVVADFDVDALLDHRARRPIMRIDNGVNTGLTWPEIEVRAGRGAGRDLILLVGPEPDHQWRAFADEVVGLAERFGATLAVGLGAFPAPVPHTRPCRLAATATEASMAERVGFAPGVLDVPAGVQAVLERRFHEAGIPAVGLWARVPHYAAAMPYPDASAALLDGLATTGGVRVDTAGLRQAGEHARARIDAFISNNPEHVQLVSQLESQVDAELRTQAANDIPTGDEIAAELERFLRDQ